MVVKGLYTDVILGQRFMKRRRNVVFATGGLENDFVLGDSSACRVAASKTPILICSEIYSRVENQ